jgi:hypothetical protein
MCEIENSFDLKNTYPFNMINAMNPDTRWMKEYIDIYDVCPRSLITVMEESLEIDERVLLRLIYKENLSLEECGDRVFYYGSKIEFGHDTRKLAGKQSVEYMHRLALKKLKRQKDKFLYSKLEEKFEKYRLSLCGFYNEPIADLGLSTRSYNLLFRRYSKISDIVHLTDEDLLEIWGVGKSCVNEIRTKLNSYTTNKLKHIWFDS